MGWLEIVAKNAGYISTIIALVAIVLPKTRNLLVNWFKKSTGIDKLSNIMEAQAVKDAELEERANKRDKLIQDIHNSLLEHIECSRKYNEKAKERDIYFLRTQINNIYHKYMPLGYITTRAKSDLMKAFELYEEMGGNSYAKAEVDELLSLPTRF